VQQAANDATKHEPPNTIEFEGVRDSRLVASKPRGRTGPRTAAETHSTPDATAILMAAMLPLLTSLSQKRPRSPSPSHALRPPATPSCASRETSTPLSPLPASGSELRACLSDFAETTGIDLTGCEDSLMVLELTPDILPDVPVVRLCEVTGAVEGRIRKLQSYCKDWYAHLLAKKAQVKRRRLN
jgi:hypothetical protein